MAGVTLPGIKINVGWTKIRIDLTWLLVSPVLMWGVAKIYVPVMGASSSTHHAWVIAIFILAFIIASLTLHILAHAITARLLRETSPETIPVFLLADPAQVWLGAKSPGRDVMIALAGPILQVILAGLAFLVWTLQLNPSVTLVALFLMLFNLAVAAFNLTPSFPFDGGRLLRAIIWSIFEQPIRGTWLAKWLGFWLIIAITLWGVILMSEQARLEWQAAAICFVEAGLMAISFTQGRATTPEVPENVLNAHFRPTWRKMVATLMGLPLLLVTVSLMPLNYGLKAPGIATAVEPMVQVPSQYRHSADGSLLLTSVIPQAPILVAQWVYAHIDRSVQLVPEEEIIPTNQTIQSQAEQGHRMLLSSQTIAIIEGLRLAGYRITENSDGVTILSILKDSPAATVLKTGDIITHIDSQPIGSLSDLQDIMSVQTQGGVLHLEIRRGERSLEVSVPTLPPVESGGPVRIGIGAETHVTGYSLPFQVEIIPERIVGGPSAGLMFTLAVYNMVTPNDLTQGWRIAGTGTIDLGGVVGPIGSVQQKVVAAERAGAEFFLSPVENYQDAVSAARNIKVVQVTSAQEAIQFLQTLPSAN